MIATGKQFSVKQFINFVARELNLKIVWRGKGINEKGFDQTGKCIIECDKRYFRPVEVDNLLGSAKKARKILGWKPKFTIENLVKNMVQEELKSLFKKSRSND